MKKNKNCKIVQDLLPNYIDKLTTNETNEFIELHLKECSKCNNIAKNMQNDNIDELNQKKYIDFAKRFNKKINILKIILLIIIIVVIVLSLRKAAILSTLINKANKYENMNNYYSKHYQYDINSITIIENYYKDGKFCRKMSVISKDAKENNITISEYFNGEKYNLYLDYEEEKKAYLDINSNEAIMPILPVAYYKSNSILNFIINCIFGDVKTVKCNGKECYRFTNLISESLVGNDKDDVYLYVDKETGLIVRSSGGIIELKTSEDSYVEYNMVQDFYYTFNCVTDKDLEEPNIVDYTIQTNK